MDHTRITYLLALFAVPFATMMTAIDPEKRQNQAVNRSRR